MSKPPASCQPQASPSCEVIPLTREPLSAESATELAAAFKALSDPVRLRLLSLVASHSGGEACVCDLSAGFELSQPTISHHLKVLREAGLLSSERRGGLGVLPDRVTGTGAAVASARHPCDRSGCPVTDHVRRLLAEFVGTAALVAVVVGSGIAAQQLTDDVALQLLANSTATVFGLGVLILVFGPISGAHFNPVVSAADWLAGRRYGTGLTATDVLTYAIAQIAGAITGAVLSNVMFDLSAWQISTHDRITTGHLVGEVVATAGLIAVIFALARSGRAAMSAAAVASYIGAAYWFTSSTSFANPAVTIGRIFSDTFAGIAPGSVPGFILSQIIGGALGLALIVALYPRSVAEAAGNAVIPHPSTTDH